MKNRPPTPTNEFKQDKLDSTTWDVKKKQDFNAYTGTLVQK